MCLVKLETVLVILLKKYIETVYACWEKTLLSNSISQKNSHNFFFKIDNFLKYHHNVQKHVGYHFL